MKKFLKFLASLKLAVLVLLSLATLIAVGTIVEAKYDAEIASKLVYRTPWMFGILGLLAVNLSAVMVDRWPWKRRHVPFLLAHMGILILLFGGWMTMRFGLDGHMRVGIGERNRWVIIPETELTLWSSFDGDRFTKLFESEVDFFLNPPEKNPIELSTDVGPLRIVGYKPFVIPRKQVIPSEQAVGAGVRFQIQNANVHVIEWLVQERPKEFVSHDLGPARIHLGEPPAHWAPSGNEIYLKPLPNGEIEYQLLGKDLITRKIGRLKEGEAFETGWMGLEFRVLRYLPKAEWHWEFKELEAPTERTSSVAEVEFQGKKHFLQRNDVLKFFTEKGAYVLTYGSRRVDLGFEVELRRFDIGHYQGTQRAASYQSLVHVPDLGERIISMNEPLKHLGKTVYQASFEQDPKGGPPRASVFSVNQDPGRWIKYFGSLLISMGIVWLFYDKRKAARAMAPRPKGSDQ